MASMSLQQQHLPSANMNGPRLSNYVSPSFARRRALREADQTYQVQVLDTLPISRYMVLAEKLFGMFLESYQKSNLDEAYVYGMRFAQLGLATLPKHKDWQRGDTQECMQLQVSEVLSLLEHIKQKMDAEEETRAEAKAESQQAEQQEEQRQEIAVEPWNPNSLLPVADTQATADVSNHSRSTTGHSHSSSPSHPLPNAVSKETTRKKESSGKKAARKFRKLFGIPPKSSKKDSAPPTVAVVLPSRSAILESREKRDTALFEKLQNEGPSISNSGQTLEDLFQDHQNEESARSIPPQNEAPSISNSDQTLEELYQDYQNEETARLIFPPAVGGQETLASAPVEMQLPRESPALEAAEPSANEILVSNDEPVSHAAANEAIQEANGATLPSDIDESPSSSIKTGETRDRVVGGIKKRLRKDPYIEKSQVNVNELLMIELRTKLARMYTGHHVIVESSQEGEKLMNSCDSEIRIDPIDVHDRNFSLKDRGAKDILPNTLDRFDAILAKKASNENETKPKKMEISKETLKSFEILDAYLAKKNSIQDGEEESYMEYTIIEGETVEKDETVIPADAAETTIYVEDKTVNESDMYFDHSVVKPANNRDMYFDKNLIQDGEEESYLEYTVLQEERVEKDKTVMPYKKTISVEENTVNESEMYFDHSVAQESVKVKPTKDILYSPTYQDGEGERYLEEERVEKNKTVIPNGVAEKVFCVEDNTVNESDMYFDHSVAQESVKVKTAKDILYSPTCVYQDPYTPIEPQFHLKNKMLYHEFPSVNMDVGVHLDNDEMTYITMDTCFQDVDAGAKKDVLTDDIKQRVKTILHQDLWKRDLAIVQGAMEELHDMVTNQSGTKALVAEYGGIMAIIQILTGFRDNEGIQFLCCDIIGQLASEPVNKAMIISVELMPLITKSMAEHPNSDRIRDAARAFQEAVYSQ